MSEPVAWTPRNVMQECSASMTTPTPLGSRWSCNQSATCLVRGYLDGLEVNGVRAALAPEPGECCVRLGSGDSESADDTPRGR